MALYLLYKCFGDFNILLKFKFDANAKYQGKRADRRLPAVNSPCGGTEIRSVRKRGIKTYP